MSEVERRILERTRDEKLTRIENRISTLLDNQQIVMTDNQVIKNTVASHSTILAKLDSDLNGNGHPGLKQEHAACQNQMKSLVAFKKTMLGWVLTITAAMISKFCGLF